MSNKFTKLISRASAALATLILVGQTVAPMAALASETPPPSQNYNICHATGSSDNPYVENNPANAGAKFGHLGLGHQNGEDIIPPFLYDDQLYSQNWDTEGQAIWNNGCSTKGSIKIVKDAQPNDDQDFNFSFDRVGSSSDDDTFTLDDNSSESGTESTKTIDKLASGTFIVTETSAVAGWVLDSIICSEGSTATVDKPNSKVTITLGVAQSVTCTFVNQAAGSITVNKLVDADADGTFEGDNTAASELGFMWGFDEEVPARAMGSTASNVPTGSHGITENTVSGYKLTGWYYTYNDEEDYSCQDPRDAESLGDIEVSKNDTTSITLCNVAEKGTITIHKTTDFSTDDTFNFTSTLGDFSLGNDEKESFTAAPGSYTFSEQALSGWRLNDVYCEDSDAWEFVEGALTVSLKDGATIDCTFSNHKLSNVNGYKFDDLNGDGNRDEGEPTLEGWTITLTNSEDELVGSTQTNSDGYYEFADLETGSYKVCEVQQAGWVQTYPNDNSGCYLVTIWEPGESKGDNNFGNFKLGTASGFKFNDANGNGNWDEGEVKLSGWTIKLTKVCSDDLSVSELNINGLEEETNGCEETTVSAVTDAEGNYLFGSIVQGDYKVCEVQQDGWTQTAPGANNGCYGLNVATSGDSLSAANFGNKANQAPPVVLGASTTATPVVAKLVNTGSSIIQSLIFGMIILGAAGMSLFVTRRPKVEAQ